MFNGTPCYQAWAQMNSDFKLIHERSVLWYLGVGLWNFIHCHNTDTSQIWNMNLRTCGNACMWVHQYCFCHNCSANYVLNCSLWYLLGSYTTGMVMCWTYFSWVLLYTGERRRHFLTFNCFWYFGRGLYFSFAFYWGERILIMCATCSHNM